MTEQPSFTYRSFDHDSPEPFSPDETLLLIQRCLAGEQPAYVALYDQFSGIIYRLAYGLLQHREDAEEVLQDSFEYAFRRLDHYDARKSAFKTWLYRIAVSRCHNKRRRKWLPSLSLQQLVEVDVRDPAAAPPDERVALSEQQRAVWQAVGALSPKLREVAILRYYGGLQYGEIGAVLGIPTKTAESRMRLAHKTLREQLSDLA
ncbi:MAG TPA: RNA polymerase sigma factor [Promineifilum sp.]|nr:RNA polymerase sigma factor [Promineifilum sp.]